MTYYFIFRVFRYAKLKGWTFIQVYSSLETLHTFWDTLYIAIIKTIFFKTKILDNKNDTGSNSCMARKHLQFRLNIHYNLLVQVYDAVHDRTNTMKYAPSEYSEQLLHEPR